MNRRSSLQAARLPWKSKRKNYNIDLPYMKNYHETAIDHLILKKKGKALYKFWGTML